MLAHILQVHYVVYAHCYDKYQYMNANYERKHMNMNC